MAKTVVINNPIINSLFEEPKRHFYFDDEGITDRLVGSRRTSAYFVPIARPKKKAKDRQLTFDDWTADRIEENKAVNIIRERGRGCGQGRRPSADHCPHLAGCSINFCPTRPEGTVDILKDHSPMEFGISA